MSNINTYLLIILLVYMVAINLYMYIYLPHKMTFSTRRNLVVFSGGLLLIVGAIVLANLSNDINIVFSIGTILFAPYMGYFLGATKSYLQGLKKQQGKENAYG